MNERRPSFQERVRSGEGAVSLINEVDFTIDFMVDEPKETASARALRIWFKRDVEGES